MTQSRIILNGIFYFFLTLFFIIYFSKEKKIAEKMDIKKEKICKKIFEKFNIVSEKKQKVIGIIVHLIETFGTALILVLIIQRFYIGNFLIPTESMAKTIMPGDRIFGNMVIYKFKEPSREDIVIFWEPIQDKDRYTKRLMGLPGETVEIINNRLMVDGKEIKTRKYFPAGGLVYEKWIIPKKGDRVEIIPGRDFSINYKERDIDVAEIQSKLFSEVMHGFLPDIEFIVNGEKTGALLDLIHDKKVMEKLLKGETVEITLRENYYLTLGDNTTNSLDSRIWGFVSQERIIGQAIFRFWPLSRISTVR